MKLNFYRTTCMALLFQGLMSCQPDNDENTSTNNGSNNNGGNTNPTANHTCGEPNIHNPNLTYGSLTDQEGNTYKTIVIGTQEWMAENLKTSIYRNGDPIPTNLDSATWANTTNGAWEYYDNDFNYACPFGKLYNWHACMDNRQLCPVGWHVPSDAEWSTLINFLDPSADGGNNSNNAGEQMKTIGSIQYETGLWHEEGEITGSNSSGFSGIPGGVFIYPNLQSFQISIRGNWWSTSLAPWPSPWIRYLSQDSNDAYRNTLNPQFAISVRCVRD
jgi:uncharacterized protein (TIGR02145 family)